MSEVFLLTIDSLRADHVDREVFSNCWTTFETAFVRFESALANGVATPLSFPSVLTGAPAVGDGTLPSERPTLAELYAGETWAATNNPHLRSDRGYDRGFDRFSDSVPALLEDRSAAPARDDNQSSRVDVLRRAAADVLERALPGRDETDEPELAPPPNGAAHVLTALRDAMADRRGLFWAHFIDPHYQFKPQQVRDMEFAVEYTNAEIVAMNERYVAGEPSSGDLEFLTRFYEEQIRYLDRQLAAFFDDLRSAGRWEGATIVIAADHGEAFGEQGVYNHQWDADPIDPLVRVPLLVKFPGNRRGGETLNHLVQNADIVPTLAEEFDWDVDCPPNTRPLTDGGPHTVVSKSNAAVRVTTPDGVGVRRRDGSSDVDDSLGDDARAVLESASIPAVEKLSGDVPGLDEEKRRDVEWRLEALGYR